MDSSEISWLAEMGLDNSIFTDQCDFMNSLDEEVAAVLGQDIDHCLSAGNNSWSSLALINSMGASELPPPSGSEPPAKLQKTNSPSDFSTIERLPNPGRANSSHPIVLKFGNPTESPQQANSGRPLNPEEEAAVSEVLRSEGSFLDHEEPPKRAQPTKKTSRFRPPSQTYDHIVSERKRREQLSQRFVALSTIVPGLKKMDKVSVLGDAINYLKYLQERRKMLEKQLTKPSMESVVLVKKSKIMEENKGSSDEQSGSSDEQPVPEIEARVCQNHILLKVSCERQKGVLGILLSEVEKLNLTVVNTNLTSPGSLAIDVTIIAEMEKEFNLTMKEVVKRLREAF